MTANTPKSQKAKGRVFQQACVKSLVETLGINPLDIQSRDMGQSGCDIVLSAQGREICPYAIECKSVEHLALWEALGQAEANASKEGLKPLLLFKRNRSKTYAVIPFDELLRLLGAGP